MHVFFFFNSNTPTSHISSGVLQSIFPELVQLRFTLIHAVAASLYPQLLAAADTVCFLKLLWAVPYQLSGGPLGFQDVLAGRLFLRSIYFIAPILNRPPPPPTSLPILAVSSQPLGAIGQKQRSLLILSATSDFTPPSAYSTISSFPACEGSGREVGEREREEGREMF